jgi:hypothetical protein
VVRRNRLASPRCCYACRGPVRPWHRLFCSEQCFAAGYPILCQQRFWQMVEKDSPHGCWMWTGPTIRGYGTFTDVSRVPAKIYAHRFSWELANSPIPPGLFVLHDCDRYYPPLDFTYRACIRPSHLFLGTVGDNSADMYRKGRAGNRAYAKGPDTFNAKLDEFKVRQICVLAGHGRSNASLGRQFGVTRSAIRFILIGRTWKHVDRDGPLAPALEPL